MLIRTVPILFILSALSSAWAAQSELVMITGEVIRGEILSETDEILILQRQIEVKGKSMTTKMSYIKGKIAKITRDLPEEKNPITEYQAAVKRTEDNLAGHLSMIVWCREHKMDPWAVDHINKALAKSAGNEEALKHAAQLGCLEIDGQWMLEKDFAEATGTDADEKNRKAAGREKTKTVVVANQAIKAYEDAQKKLDTATIRSKTIESEVLQAKSDVRTADSDISRAEMDEKNARDDLARNKEGQITAKDNHNDNSMRFYQTNINDANKRIDRALQERKTSQRLKAEAEKKLAALERERPLIEKTLLTVGRDIDALRKAAEDAKLERAAANP